MRRAAAQLISDTVAGYLHEAARGAVGIACGLLLALSLPLSAVGGGA